MKEIVLFYTDKESIDINKSLNKKFIGKELGLMKLEQILTYGGIRYSDEEVKVENR